MTYDQAREWVKRHLKPMGIRTQKQFHTYMKTGGAVPPGFPRSPYYQFKSKHTDPREATWVSWQHFLSAEFELEEGETYRFINSYDEKYIITSNRRVIAAQGRHQGREMKVQTSKTGHETVVLRSPERGNVKISIDELMKSHFEYVV